MADWESQKIDRTSISDLLQLIGSFDAMGARAETRHANKTSALAAQLTSANTTSEIQNLSNLISKHNQQSKSMGLEEYSLDNIYDEKLQSYKTADVAYKQIENIYDENNFLAEGIASTEDLYDKISSMNWEEMTRANSSLYKLKNKIEEAKALGHKYTSDKGVTSAGLSKAIDTRLGQIGARMHIWEENEGEFMVFDENGEMDEASRQMYDEYMYDIMSGDVASFKKKYDKDITLTQQKYQSQLARYNSLNYLHEQSKAKSGEEVREVFASYIKNQVDDDTSEEDRTMYNNLYANLDEAVEKTGANQQIDEQWFISQRANSMESGKKYNTQYEILTGDKFDTNPTWLGFDPAKETIAIAQANANKKSQAAADKITEIKEGKVKIPQATDTFEVLGKT